MPFAPQINYFDSSGIGNDTGWYKVEGVFQAQGGEQYMTIGNFNTDINTSAIIVNPGQTPGAYYYIDSVSLVQVTCPIDIGVHEIANTSTYKLYPNPNEGNMIFEYSLSEASKGMFMLYDVTGRLINSYKLTEGQNNTLKISEDELQNGIYFYQIIVNDYIVQGDKLIIIK